MHAYIRTYVRRTTSWSKSEMELNGIVNFNSMCRKIAF